MAHSKNGGKTPEETRTGPQAINTLAAGAAGRTG